MLSDPKLQCYAAYCSAFKECISAWSGRPTVIPYYDVYISDESSKMRTVQANICCVLVSKALTMILMLLLHQVFHKQRAAVFSVSLL